ncbi:glycosyltransferase family 2 protein [Roseivivax sp. GX 12232]|uniref:glycosyltransferase n=1 Tax=Roseivivax sp. GX 12232 TaxID=2900547 RepID=UPI001E650E20|nr:glycosyltransferase [Roseivivax sp. GX 12232]MCE0506956.1 glycosyltransferase family 2 protein [Roseivivax sp. GX 12232]
MLGHLAYIALCAAIALAVHDRSFSGAEGAILTLGAIGAWRYSWGAINFSRALAYIHWRYPRQRRRAEAAYARRAVPAHGYFMVTTFKIEPRVTARVYASIFEAAAASPGGATIVASVVEGADLRIIRDLFEARKPQMPGVKLVIDQIPGSGKRDAIARSLRLLQREAPSPRDVLVFVDGDSCVPEDIVARSAPFFTDSRVGALTTDEQVEIEETPLFRDWFELRFTQRQMMMSSMAFGGRVLTLTGRMSVFRADLATDPSFIAQVQSDQIDHWRLGRIRFLTGDDKSTWYWLLSRGYRMTYLPDLHSLSMEEQPKPGFVESAVALMKRWFGNMLRTNGRAMALGPWRIGLFTWWSIVDQRLSIWTTLAGPLAVIATALLATPAVLPAYLAWIMFTRYVYCAALSLFRPGYFPIVFPPLLYFGQIVGASVKSYALFRLDRQKWTRQSASGGGARPAFRERVKAASSTGMHALAFGWLAIGALFLTGLL